MLIRVNYYLPYGILFSVPVMLYVIFHFRETIRTSHILIGTFAGLALLIIVLTWSMNIGGRFDFMVPFRKKLVLCYMQEMQSESAIRTLETGDSLTGLLYYITHNPGHFSSLAIKKFLTFFGLTRSYFSVSHNIFLVAYFYPPYLAYVLSLRYWVKKGLLF